MDIDQNKSFPNQLLEGRPEECTAETVNDILGNIYKVKLDAGFTYAATRHIQNVLPSIATVDPFFAMQSAILFGVLPSANETFDARTSSQAYEGDFSHYTLAQKQLAHNFIQKGVKKLNSFSDIVSYLQTYQKGVSLTVYWYENFMSKNIDGTLPVPSGEITVHNVAVYDSTPLGLMIKPWLGPDYGYTYISHSLFNQIFLEASAFDPNGWRWFSLAKIGVQNPHFIGDVLPEMKKEIFT